MRRSLSIAFWNVENLFAAGAVPKRGPQSQAELEAKLAALAGVVGRLDNGRPPDLLALVEVAERPLVHALTSRLNLAASSPLPVVFEPSSNKDIGIAVVALQPSVAGLTRVAAEQRGHRPRALIVKVELAATSPPLHLAVCHWKSNRATTGTMSNQRDRQASGEWLRKSFDGATSPLPDGQVDPIVVVGDFNAEPFAREISHSPGLHATRHYQKSLRSNGPRLFNCTWPWLVDPGASAIPGHPFHAGPRSLTTVTGGEPAIFDQLLVSRSVLRGDSFALEDVDFHRDADTAHLRPQARQVVPRRWAWDGSAGSGTSDHFPLLARLLY